MIPVPMSLLQNKVRIVGGQWRSRKISFPNAPGLRPTADRVRETLFNWLAHSIVGANCLDLFAGSGVLGFEALSRGALQVTFVDHSATVVESLRENALRLGANHSVFLKQQCPFNPSLVLAAPFDIVFLDPPFGQGLIATASQWLCKNHLLKPNALIYLEAEYDLQPLPVPQTWQILRQKETATLRYYLFKSE